MGHVSSLVRLSKLGARPGLITRDPEHPLLHHVRYLFIEIGAVDDFIIN